jgi:hypothetical protein
MAQKLYWKAKFASEYRRNMLCHNNDLSLEGLTKHLQNKFGIKHGSTKVMYQDDGYFSREVKNQPLFQRMIGSC